MREEVRDERWGRRTRKEVRDENERERVRDGVRGRGATGTQPFIN